MENNTPHQIIRVRQGRSEQLLRHTVTEYPLRLRVNGNDLATLVCSPHQLNYLLTGFFRLQGFIDTLDDILLLEVCEKYGLAEIHLNDELPERLQPTLTSGCGTGIAYNLPTSLLNQNKQRPRYYTTGALLRLMKELNDLTEHYRSHGGIHSAAIGDYDGSLLLHAEDIGRHNTIDRVAGEAMVTNLDLVDKMLVTSGRISTEMVAKAARLGVGLVASRTSPTDKAITLCEQAGITLVGYVRGQNMDVFTHPHQLSVSNEEERITDVTGVILAGGESRRMGSNKSLLPLDGARFIDQVYRRMESLFNEVIIVTNTPDIYKEIPCRKVPDMYYAQGSLAGLHSGLTHARNEKIFVAACDMPFISPAVVKEICAHGDQGDLVIPYSSNGHEPLHALYSKSCLPAMEQVLDAGQKRIISFFDKVKRVKLPASTIRRHDPDEKTFKNINTPEDYYRLRGTVIDTDQPERRKVSNT
ncbi:formate dehydrogenase accessory sulfurtransferase FdhD [Desulfogranum japonicum]|uniref:formate dehydrogenase accessory sulfurtransferase FdhD n=1 Tax=Desulfogranum japonicum TaxID=231447 RepID=UPI000684117B|nr:formate dehydrogenase accessory sulfurtransferase FdhD [Desulfogranum japonicum]